MKRGLSAVNVRVNNDFKITKCNSAIDQPSIWDHTMHNISIRVGGYDISIILIVILGVMLGTVVAATYMWTTKTTTVTIQEPLTITNYPATIQTHPGQNQTLNITIQNTATVSYTVTLTFMLNDTTYQTNYVTFSNNTYTVNPGTNYLTAWMATAKKAPPATIQLTTQFYRE